MFEGNPIGYADIAIKADAQYAMMYYENITKEFVDDAHKKNIEVFVYTVNTKPLAQEMQKLGVDGICGAIFNAAGWQELQDACDEYPKIHGKRCPVGQARITKSFNLEPYGIEHIIHAVGPDCRIIKNEQEQNNLLKAAYTNSLLLAQENRIKSIAFPFISSAIYAFPKERAATIAISTVINFVKLNQTSLIEIHFVLFSKEDFDAFNAILKNMIA